MSADIKEKRASHERQDNACAATATNAPKNMASKSPAFALLPLITPYGRSTPGGGQSRKSRASPDSQMDLKPQRLGPCRQQEMKAAGCCWCKTVPPQMYHALESLPPLTTTVGKWRGLVAVSNEGQ